MPEAQRRLACAPSSKTKHSAATPPSSPSDDGAVKSGDGVKIPCFFAVLDPENTEKLKGTKNSACLNGFKDINRLREHLLRAHSPTHNCRYCRKKTTKPTEDFRKEHARCRPGANTKSSPLPTLISTAQAEALQNLNQHFNKPNDEVSRCKKLLGALFPEVKFDEELFMSSHIKPRANGSKTDSMSGHASSPSKQKSQRQPQTPTAVSRSQNATPPASPPAPERTVVDLGNVVDVSQRFSMVAKPSEGNYSTKPQTLSRGSRDSGIGTELSSFDDISSPDGKRSGTPERQGSPGRERRKSSSGNVTELMGIELGLDRPIPKAGYPQRVLEEQEGTDIDMEEASAPAVQDHFTINLHLGQRSPTASSAYDSRSEYSDGTSSQQDIDKDRCEREFDSDSDVDMPTIQNPHDVLNAIHRHVLNLGPDGEDYGSSFHDMSESGSDAESDS